MQRFCCPCLSPFSAKKSAEEIANKQEHVITSENDSNHLAIPEKYQFSASSGVGIYCHLTNRILVGLINILTTN